MKKNYDITDHVTSECLSFLAEIWQKGATNRYCSKHMRSLHIFKYPLPPSDFWHFGVESADSWYHLFSNGCRGMKLLLLLLLLLLLNASGVSVSDY